MMCFGFQVAFESQLVQVALASDFNQNTPPANQKPFGNGFLEN